MKRKDKEGWVRKCVCIKVEGAMPKLRWRPRKTWLEVVGENLR